MQNNKFNFTKELTITALKCASEVNESIKKEEHIELSKNDLLTLLNVYVRGKHAGKLKEDAEKLIDKLLHNELEIEGYKKRF